MLVDIIADTDAAHTQKEHHLECFTQHYNSRIIFNADGTEYKMPYEGKKKCKWDTVKGKVNSIIL